MYIYFWSDCINKWPPWHSPDEDLDQPGAFLFALVVRDLSLRMRSSFIPLGGKGKVCNLC